MPGAYAHITLVNELKEPQRLEKIPGFPREAISAILKYFKFCELGAVSPDYPYLAIGDAGAKKLADIMHYTRTGEVIHAGVRRLLALGGAEKMKGLAWLLGFTAHVTTDVTIHPVVEKKVGKYQGNEKEHRICEMHQDAYIFQTSESWGNRNVGTPRFGDRNLPGCRGSRSNRPRHCFPLDRYAPGCPLRRICRKPPRHRQVAWGVQVRDREDCGRGGSPFPACPPRRHGARADLSRKGRYRPAVHQAAGHSRGEKKLRHNLQCFRRERREHLGVGGEWSNAGREGVSCANRKLEPRHGSRVSTKHDPAQLEPFVNYILHVSREDAHAVVIVCDKDEKVGLLEDAGCSSEMDRHLWKEDPPKTCMITLKAREVCPEPALQ